MTYFAILWIWLRKNSLGIKSNWLFDMSCMAGRP